MNKEEIDWLVHLVNTAMLAIRNELQKEKAALLLAPPKQSAKELPPVERILLYLKHKPMNRVEFNARLSHDLNAHELSKILADLEKQNIIEKTIVFSKNGHQKPVWSIKKQVSNAKQQRGEGKDIKTVIFEQLKSGPKTARQIRIHVSRAEHSRSLVACLQALETNGEVVRTYSALPGSKRASTFWQLSKDQNKTTKKTTTGNKHFKTYTLGA